MKFLIQKVMDIIREESLGMIGEDLKRLFKESATQKVKERIALYVYNNSKRINNVIADFFKSSESLIKEIPLIEVE